MENFWEFTENMNEAVYVTDIDTHELVYMNKKLRGMYGISAKEDYIGKKCHEFMQKCAAPCAMCNNNELKPNQFCEWVYYNPLHKQTFSIKDTLIEADGRRYRMEIAIRIDPQEWRMNIVRNGQDLSALANEILRLALKKETPEESVRFFLEYIGKMLKGERAYVFEKHGDGTDSNTYEWCAAGVKPMIQTLQKLPAGVCRAWYKAFREDKYILIMRVEDIKEIDPLQYENLKRQDISSLIVVPLYDAGEIIGFYGVDNPGGDTGGAYDILQMLAHFIVASIKRRDLIKRLRLEEQKQTASSLKQEMAQILAARTQENLDIINEIIGSGMWSMDFNERGEMTGVVWSPKFREMLGFSGEGDFPNVLESWSERVHPEERAEQIQAFWDGVWGKKEYDVKYRAMKKNGEYQWFHAHGRATRYENGRPRFFIGTFINVTEQLKAQQALEDAYQAANRANAAKTEFLASMSHDIRTPLNAIVGMTAIAAANLGDAEKVRHCLSEITVSSRHLLALINEVLDMNKIESGKISLNETEFKLADVLDGFVSVSKPLVRGKGHNFSVNIHDIKHENVIGDAGRLQQCLVNFMSNAVKYTPCGGDIRISVTEKPTNRSKIGCYEFVFEDNGIGMSEDFVKVMFEPFARADDERAQKQQGTGLGMSIARNIIRMMNGDIKVESRLNEGTKVTATVFLEVQDENEKLEIESLADLPVLVADDDRVACESTCFILDELGMNGEWVLSGREAVAKVAERHERRDDFFAVIVDWRMPDMDGVETTRAIRAAVGGGVPIIIISAYDWTDIEADARAAGANAFIAKPIFKSKVARTFLELGGKGSAESGGEAAALAKFRDADFKGARVLLVEDNEINAEIAKEILEMTELSVDVAWNGAEAVEKLEACADGFYKLVFMDIQMPVMNGYEATQKIRGSARAYLQSLPIIAMSANAFAEDVMKSKAVGMNDHVAKPLDFAKLLEVLDKWAR